MRRFHHTRFTTAWAAMALAALLAAPALSAQDKLPRKIYGGPGNIDLDKKQFTVHFDDKDWVVQVTDKTLFIHQNRKKLGDLEDGMFVAASGEFSDDKGTLVTDTFYVLPPEQQGKPGVGKKNVSGTLRVKDGNMSVEAGDKTVQLETTPKTSVTIRTVGGIEDLKEGYMCSYHGPSRAGDMYHVKTVYMYPYKDKSFKK